MVFFVMISVFEATAVIKICKFTVFTSGSFCQIYRVTDEAVIAETMVWRNIFLMTVFFALTGSKLFLIISLRELSRHLPVRPSDVHEQVQQHRAMFH